MENIIATVVHAGNLSDNHGGIALVDKLEIQEQTSRLEKILVDAGYKVTFIEYVNKKFEQKCKVEVLHSTRKPTRLCSYKNTLGGRKSLWNLKFFQEVK